MPVSLGYKGVALEGIENNPANHYSARGQAGWDDYLKTGKIRPSPAYEEVYFSKGAPLNKYADRSGGTHIVETNTPRMGFAKNGFPAIKALDSRDFFNVYEQSPDKTYNKIYTNVPSSMTRRALGTVGSALNKMAFPLQVAETVWNATEDRRNKNAYKQWLIDRSNIPMNTEIRSGRR